MKKTLLSFFVIILFNFTNLHSTEVWDYLRKGMNKKEFKKYSDGGWSYGNQAISGKAVNYNYTDEIKKVRSNINQNYIGRVFHYWSFNEYFPEYKTEILTHRFHNEIPKTFPENYIFYIFENVSTPKECQNKKRWTNGCKGTIGDGVLKDIAFTFNEAIAIANPKMKKERERIAKLKKKAKEKELKQKKENEYKLLISNLEKKFNSQCESGILNPKGFKKGSKDYNDCLISKHKAEKQKIIDQKEEARKKKLAESNRIKKEMALLKQMNPEERSIYKCENTFGYKKGTTKHKECVFELYKTEIEFEKLQLQKANEKQRLELEREKVKAANAQAEAAKEQAEAARRNAQANESSAATADSERRRKMRERGIRSLGDNCILKGTC